VLVHNRFYKVTKTYRLLRVAKFCSIVSRLQIRYEALLIIFYHRSLITVEVKVEALLIVVKRDH